MTERRYSAALPYFGAVALVAAAVVFRSLMDPILGNRQPFSAFIVAVIFAGRYCGFAPSLLAIVLSAAASRYFFVVPRQSFVFPGTVESGSLFFFVALGLFCSWIMRAEYLSRREFAQEIEKRKQTEAELLLALEAGRLGLWNWDIATDRVRSTETQAIISGRTSEETDTSLEQAIRAVHPEDRHILEEVVERSLRNKAPDRVVYRVVWPDGGVHWIEAVGRVVCDAAGRPTQIMGVCADITERKLAEDKLRARESQLSGILDNTTAVVYLKDAEGRYLLVNRRHRDLFQHGEDVVGKKDADIFPPDVARTFMESDAVVWREQSPLDFVELAPHADGLHTYRSVKFPVRDEAGRMIALGGISTDISDLKEAHDALQSKQELLRNLIEVQEKEKQFLCHEFHDGLIQYAVGSQMLLESYRNKAASNEDVATIDKVIGHLRRGIDDGRRVIRGIRPAVLDDSGLQAAIDDLTDQYWNSCMTVTSNCDPEIGRLPNTIQTTVYRVVQEALTNAKFHSGSDLVRIELTKSNGDLRLEVRDFGRGFDVHSPRRKGFGLLGMTERVRLLGGECSIHSEPGAGTSISVRLPISGEG